MKLYLFVFASALLLAACTPEAVTPGADGSDTVTPAPAANDPAAPSIVPEASPPAPEQVPSAPVAEAPQAPAAPDQPAPQPANTQRDGRLVGVWVNENIINSGGSNFASYTTVMTMEIYPDGQIVQYTESIGGGGDWSYDGGRTLDFQGEWRADGQTLSVNAEGLPGFTPAATYSFSGGYMVTQSHLGRLIWQKRG